MEELKFNNSLNRQTSTPPTIADISSDNREVKKVCNAQFTKPSLLQRIRNTFVSDDASNVGSYILQDVIVPSVQDGMINAAISAVTMIFGGGRRSNYYGGYRPYRSYDNYSRASWRETDRYDNRAPYSGPDYRRDEYMSTRSYKDVEIDSYEGAIEALHELYSLLERYGMVRVADYFSAAGLTGDAQSNDWGWYDLPPRLAPRKLLGGGWKIDLPRPEPLRR